MQFTFSGCVEFASGESPSSESEFAMCESHIEVESKDENIEWLVRLNIEQVADLEVESLLVSDGSDIWRKQHISRDSLQVFTTVSTPFKPEFKQRRVSQQWYEDIGIGEDDFYVVCIWYELIKLLSGGRVRCDPCENVIDYSKIVCQSDETSPDGPLSFIMELRVGTIVRKLAQFSLEMVQTGEIDLFLLSSRIFEAERNANNLIYKLIQETDSQRNKIETFEAEKQALDVILSKRDAQTKAIMVNLLNEKKKKIVELETKLIDFEHKISDSDLINQHVKEAVSELNSPGKRKRKFGTEFRSPTSSTRKRRTIDTNNTISGFRNNTISSSQGKIKRETREEDEFEDFDDSKYMGINKRLDLSQFDPTNSLGMGAGTGSPNVKVEERGLEDYNDESRLKQEAKSDSPFEEVKKEESNESFDDFIDKDNEYTNNDDSDDEIETRKPRRYIRNNKKRKSEALESSTDEESDSTDVETDTG